MDGIIHSAYTQSCQTHHAVQEELNEWIWGDFQETLSNGKKTPKYKGAYKGKIRNHG
jgi:hypothetical protein